MDDEAIALFKKYGTWYVPTIIAGKSVADSAKKPGYFLPVIAGKALLVGPMIQGTFAKAYKAGVKIALVRTPVSMRMGRTEVEFVHMTEAVDAAAGGDQMCYDQFIGADRDQ